MPLKPAGPPSSRAPVSELSSHLGYWLRFVSQHVSGSFRRKVEAAGVTVSEWVLLRTLYSGAPGSPGELGQALGMTKGAVSKLLARLEAAGLIRRSVVTGDRRQQAVELTDGGRALVPLLARLADQNDEEFFGHLPPARRAELREAMEEIVRRRQLSEVPID